MSSAYSYHIPIVILSLNKPNLSPYYIKVVTCLLYTSDAADEL